MTREKITEIIKEVLNEEETVDFHIMKSPAGHSVLAKLGNRIIGKLRVRNRQGRSEVDSVMVNGPYRGMGIGKNLYRLAHDELGPLYSDKAQTADAKALWNSLLRDEEAEEVEIDGEPRYKMTENIHNPVRPGILKRQISGKITCTKARALKAKQKNKGNNTAKAAQRFINYHC